MKHGENSRNLLGKIEMSKAKKKYISSVKEWSEIMPQRQLSTSGAFQGINRNVE